MQPDSIVHNAKIATNGVPSFVEQSPSRTERSVRSVAVTRFCGNVGRRQM